jgi:hypothetical protein
LLTAFESLAVSRIAAKSQNHDMRMTLDVRPFRSLETRIRD